MEAEKLYKEEESVQTAIKHVDEIIAEMVLVAENQMEKK
jgi:hypothetical protein